MSFSPSYCVGVLLRPCLWNSQCVYPYKTTILTQHCHCRNVPPQLTLDHVSPATRLLEKRRQKMEVQEALEAQKADFAR